MKDLQPHQQRVVDEKTELDDKINKLSSFISENPIYGKLPEIDQELLSKQYSVMQEYSDLLAHRVARF